MPDRPSLRGPLRRVGISRQGKAIDFVQRFHRQQIGRRIEVVQVGDEDAARVPQLAVDVDHSREDLFADPQFLGELGHRDPQPDDLRATLLDDFLRHDGVAEGLRHLASLEIDQEAVGQHLSERGPAACRQRDEQRALEPAAVLVAAFQIHVRRPAQFRRARQHRFVARAGIEPHVENVALALEGIPSA